MLFTALAVDAGRLWFQTRQLQTVADLAAIEAGQRVACAGEIGPVLAAAQAAAARNGYSGNLGAAPNAVEIGTTVTGAGGVRSFVAGAGATAVRVAVTQTVNASLVAGGWLGGQTTLRAEAVAAADSPIAAFRLGSSTASLDAGLLNTLLGALIQGSGNPLTLELVSYQGLANAQVSLHDLLAVSADAGTVDELLATDLSVAEFLQLVADALDGSEVASVAAKAASRSLAGVAVDNLNLRLADVINVAAPAQEVAANVGLNVLELVTAAAMVANGDNAVALDLGIPGVAAVSLRIVEPPQLAVGPPGCTVARTAQVALSVKLPTILAGLDGAVDLELHVKVAQADASLEAVRRANGVTEVDIRATPGVADIELEGTVLGRLLTVGLELSLGSKNGQQLDFSVDHPVAQHLPQSASASSGAGESLHGALSNPNLLHVDVADDLRLVDQLLAAVVKPLVGAIVAPVLATVGEQLLDPLLKLLGLELGKATVQLDAVQLRGERQLLR